MTEKMKKPIGQKIHEIFKSTCDFVLLISFFGMLLFAPIWSKVSEYAVIFYILLVLMLIDIIVKKYCYTKTKNANKTLLKVVNGKVVAQGKKLFGRKGVIEVYEKFYKAERMEVNFDNRFYLTDGSSYLLKIVYGLERRISWQELYDQVLSINPTDTIADLMRSWHYRFMNESRRDFIENIIKMYTKGEITKDELQMRLLNFVEEQVQPNLPSTFINYVSLECERQLQDIVDYQSSDKNCFVQFSV